MSLLRRSCFLERLPLRHNFSRSRYARPGTQNFRRVRQLRMRVPLLRSKKWDVPTALAIFALIHEVSDAIDICCNFIRVHHAPGQSVVNEVWKETRMMMDLLKNLEELEAKNLRANNIRKEFLF